MVPAEQKLTHTQTAAGLSTIFIPSSSFPTASIYNIEKTLFTKWSKSYFLYFYTIYTIGAALRPLGHRRNRFSLSCSAREGALTQFSSFSSMAKASRISRATFSLFRPRILMFFKLAVHRHSRQWAGRCPPADMFLNEAACSLALSLMQRPVCPI